MQQAMQDIIEQYVTEIQKIYQTHLKKIILYGSYARGDFREDSDVDIMILVDLQDDEKDTLSMELSEVGFHYNVDYSVWIMPVVKNIDHFHYWLKAYPFYKNVAKEGIVLYEAA